MIYIENERTFDLFGKYKEIKVLGEKRGYITFLEYDNITNNIEIGNKETRDLLNDTDLVLDQKFNKKAAQKFINDINNYDYSKHYNYLGNSWEKDLNFINESTEKKESLHLDNILKGHAEYKQIIEFPKKLTMNLLNKKIESMFYIFENDFQLYTYNMYNILKSHKLGRTVKYMFRDYYFFIREEDNFFRIITDNQEFKIKKDFSNFYILNDYVKHYILFKSKQQILILS